MAGLLSKFKTLVGVEEEEYYEDEYEEEVVAPEPERSRRETRESRETRETRHAEDERRWQPQSTKPSRERENVISMRENTLKAITSQFKIVVMEPHNFDDCPKLVDSLKARKPVIINLEKAATDTARKIFDFLSGATYAVNGKVQKIANNIFVFLPENVDVSGGSQEHTGLTFGKGDGNPWKL